MNYLTGNKLYFFIAPLVACILASCSQDFVPKPAGYFRIDLPEHNYTLYEANCPFSMEVPNASKVELVREHMSSDSCWFNVVYPRHRAKIHFTYLPVNGNFDQLAADTYEFAMKHEMKADAIVRTPFEVVGKKVYGQLYDLKGESASQCQFYITDSTKHFMRAALYFEVKPNPDSIAPVLAYIREDIFHMTESVIWK